MKQFISFDFWSKIGRQFLPVFLIAALLPVMLVAISSPGYLSLSSRAAKTQTLRVWLEPANVIASAGQPIELFVMAAYEAESNLLPSLEAKIVSVPPLIVTPQVFISNKPFRGRTSLGKIIVQAKTAGRYEVSLPVQDIKTGSTEPVVIDSGGTSIIIK